MRQIRTHSDKRLDLMCSYCGGYPNTADHVPSRVFLDEPYPDNLPVVPCCLICNTSFSLDEEYIACILECISANTTKIEELKREKIKEILSRKGSLHKRITNSFINDSHNPYFQIEKKRLINVIIKLAKGHFKFESSASKITYPKTIWMKPLNILTQNESEIFFSQPQHRIISEIGSRTSQQILLSENTPLSPWIEVQHDYRYLVHIDIDISIVKIILGNYLGAIITWEEDM